MSKFLSVVFPVFFQLNKPQRTGFTVMQLGLGQAWI